MRSGVCLYIMVAKRCKLYNLCSMLLQHTFNKLSTDTGQALIASSAACTMALNALTWVAKTLAVGAIHPAPPPHPGTEPWVATGAYGTIVPCRSGRSADAHRVFPQV